MSDCGREMVRGERGWGFGCGSLCYIKGFLFSSSALLLSIG